MLHRWEHNIIRTPIDTVNIVGAGGLDQGTIIECAGPPQSGKSAFAYGVASNFLSDNEDGIVVILDPELSTDLIRLEHTFNLDMTRVIIRNARTLEDGFFEFNQIVNDLDAQSIVKETTEDFIKKWDLKEAVKLMKEVKLNPDLELLDTNCSSPETVSHAQKSLTTLLAFKGKLKPKRPTPVIIVWDTLASSIPKVEIEAIKEGKDPLNAGGMGLRARILSTNLAIMMTALYNKPITVFLLNQIRMTGFGTWKGPEETSSGGHALKHTVHYSFWFERAKKIYDEEKKMNIGSTSKVSILKSKFGPVIEDIPIHINDMVGGRIVPEDEAALVAKDLGILHSAGGWWKFRGSDTGYRWDKQETGKYISRNPEVRQLCLERIAHHFRMNYYTLDVVYKKIGLHLGDLNAEDLKERDGIFDSSIFKPTMTIDGNGSASAMTSLEEDEEDPFDPPKVTKATKQKKRKNLPEEDDEGEDPFAAPAEAAKAETTTETTTEDAPSEGLSDLWASVNGEGE